MDESNDRRRTGRVRQRGLESNLGPVLDLSAGGVRILSTRPITGERTIVLQGVNDSISIRAHVVWRKRLGFMRHDIGLAFVEPNADLVRTLSRLAASHRVDRPIAA